MNWLQRYRLRRYLRNSIWIEPTLAVVLAILSVQVLHAVDTAWGWQMDAQPESARSILGALAGAMFTFIVFVCSSLLLVVQLASAQLTPRVIGTMFRDRVTKVALSIFVFTFTFVLSAMIRIEQSVPLLTTLLAAYGCAACIAMFLYLINHIGLLLRPSGVFKVVTAEAHRVIDQVYPQREADRGAAATSVDELLDHEPSHTLYSKQGGVVLAFDREGLIKLAMAHDCVIELVPQVGDFVAPRDPLFHVFGGQAALDEPLRQAIELGAERTQEQDPAFAFRIIVDIASRALSPAINDPTTAVLAIDQLHHLLRHVGGRRLDIEKMRDASGRVRVRYRTPDWEDFVQLAVTEILQFGGGSIQVVRRLKAMLEDLLRHLPDQRHEPLQQKLRLLKKASERSFLEPEDRVMAEESDAQGVGGTKPSTLPRLQKVAPSDSPLRQEGR